MAWIAERRSVRRSLVRLVSFADEHLWGPYPHCKLQTTLRTSGATGQTIEELRVKSFFGGR